MTGIHAAGQVIPDLCLLGSGGVTFLLPQEQWFCLALKALIEPPVSVGDTHDSVYVKSADLDNHTTCFIRFGDLSCKLLCGYNNYDRYMDKCSLYYSRKHLYREQMLAKRFCNCTFLTGCMNEKQWSSTIYDHFHLAKRLFYAGSSNSAAQRVQITSFGRD